MSKRIYARNKVLLARAINISPPALRRLFELADHPKQINGRGYDIEQWQRYADNNIQFWRQRDPHAPKVDRNARDAAYIERQEIEAQKAQFDLDVKRGRYTPKEETRKEVMTYFGMLVHEGDKAFLHELPPRLEGLTASEIAKLLGRRWQEIRDRVATALEGKNGHNGHNGLAVA